MGTTSTIVEISILRVLHIGTRFLRNIGMYPTYSLTLFAVERIALEYILGGD